MPVTTRSQSRNSMQVEAINLNSVANGPQANKVYSPRSSIKPDQTNMLAWFIRVMVNSLRDMEERAKIKHEHVVLSNSAIYIDQSNEIIMKCRENYFDNVRRVTEMFYFVDQYLPVVYPLKPADFWERYITTTYKKIHDLYSEIRTSAIPVTEDEQKTITAAISVLQDSEKNIIPLLPSGYPTKRIRNFVFYAGMDMIEPEDEFDGITNPYSYDPDYIPSDDDY